MSSYGEAVARWCVLATIAGVCGARVDAADWALARRGVPAAGIVISAGAKPEERLAGSELQDYVRKVSGASLPIATTGRSTSLLALVRIGAFGSEAVAEWRGDRPDADGFVLQTKGNTLFIVGGDARGALYGTYEMIERALGVRWFMPGELGEDVPTRDSIPLPQLDLRKKPAFAHVYGLIWGGGAGAEAWEQRMRGRTGPTENFAHNWAAVLPLNAQNFAANPEWFAEVGGGRGRSNQLCSAHPDVVRFSVEAARRYFAANPQAQLFSVSPNDGYGFCEDARCRAVDALYGVTDGSISDRLVHYANEVLTELEKTDPGRQIGVYAYVTHSAPPRRAVPAPGYATMVVHMPWEYCHVHTVTDPSCAPNRRFDAYLRGWSAVTRHSGVYEFYGHFFVGATWPVVHAIRRDVPYYAELGVERLTSETQQHWATQGLNFYVLAKLAWDPKTDVDALLDEYFTRFYGRAAAPMRRYWERWEEAMIATAALGDGGYEWLQMFTNAIVAETGGYLAEAERLAAQDREKIQRRVAFVKLGHAYTEAWTQIIEASRRGDIAAANAWGDEALRRARLTSGSVPQALYLYVVEIQTRYLVSIVASGQLPWVALRP